MYINKEQLEQRLNKTDLLIIEKQRKPREKKSEDPDSGESRLTHEDRVAIGIFANSELATQKEIAEILGISPQTVSNNSRALVAPESGVDLDLKADINRGIAKTAEEKLKDAKKIEDQLLTNLAAALGHVANNIDNTDAAQASKIAVDMSKILNQVTNAGSEQKHRTAIIINVPSMKDEKHYQTIDV